MRIGDIRNELESYGVSTAQFLEKKDMKDALEKARSEGKTPLNGSPSSNTTESTSPSTNATASTSENRSDRLKDAMEKARLMKVGDLKKELLARGVSTKTFFEKTEFVKAYAEAVVDGVSATSGSSSSGGANAKPEEPRDPDYRDVVVQKITRGDPRQIQGTVIDVTKK